MTRTYKRKRWGSRERRMEAAVRLRAEGLSLREIGERLKVSHQTVKRDLESVTSAVTIFPPGGRNVTADVTAVDLSQVVHLAERRRA
jgi:transposase-like protein